MTISSVSFGSGSTRKSAHIDKVYLLDDGGVKINGKNVRIGAEITPEQVRILNEQFDEVLVSKGKFEGAYNTTDRLAPTKYSDVLAKNKAARDARRQRAAEKLQSQVNAQRVDNEAQRAFDEVYRKAANEEHVRGIKSKYSDGSNFSELAAQRRQVLIEQGKLAIAPETPSVKQIVEAERKAAAQKGYVENLPVSGKSAKDTAEVFVENGMTPRKRFANGERLQIVEELTPKQAEKAKQRAFREAKKAYEKEISKNPNGPIAKMVEREKARIAKWNESEGARRNWVAKLKERVSEIMKQKSPEAVDPNINITSVEFDMTTPAAPQPQPAKPVAEAARESVETAARTTSETTGASASTVKKTAKDAAKKGSETVKKAAKDAKGTPVGKIIGIGAAIVAAAAGIYYFATRSKKNSEAYSQVPQN